VNKLLERLDGGPLVVRAVDALLASSARPVLVVTGHQAEAVRAALAGRDVETVDNPRHAEGMASSLRAGVAALPPGVAGALVCLADMPRVRAEHVGALLEAFDPDRGGSICVPVHAGRRGHPVLFAARHFAELLQLSGDRGARALLEARPDVVREVPVDDDGVLVDIDTPEEFQALEDASR
jgi:molybdenum cofactor cytidylyltransferase